MVYRPIYRIRVPYKLVRDIFITGRTPIFLLAVLRKSIRVPVHVAESLLEHVDEQRNEHEKSKNTSSF